MSKSVRTEQQRLVAELAALVQGLNDEVTRLEQLLTECEKELRGIRAAIQRMLPS